MTSLAIVAAALADGGGRRKNAVTVLMGPPAVRMVNATCSVAIAMVVVAGRGVVDGSGHFLNIQSTQQKSSQRLMSMGKHDSIC